jgi:hypothetical protein
VIFVGLFLDEWNLRSRARAKKARRALRMRAERWELSQNECGNGKLRPDVPRHALVVTVPIVVNRQYRLQLDFGCGRNHVEPRLTLEADRLQGE